MPIRNMSRNKKALSPYTIRSIEFTMKLEPIIELSNGNLLAFEVLSQSKDIDVNNDLFFKCLTTDELLQVFQRQLEMYQKLNEQDAKYFSSVFINVPVDFVSDMELIMELYPFHCLFKINLEVECSPSTFLVRDSLRSCTKLLSAMGIRIWLDDIKVSEISAAKDLISQRVIYGVKIDKISFWDSYYKKLNLTNIINGLSDRIILEGVEDISHLNYAKSQSIMYGQGYLWPTI
ncbi:EAL domain-containing protein [Aeromonas hydrophila]|uniref:EAL domain-containing protein n=1 Tax=Aeromonas hydrophila TaxID=644 RepID=UPI002AC32E03|nr:EAL domain-containing protein [Aeromonas hydrophila]